MLLRRKRPRKRQREYGGHAGSEWFATRANHGHEHDLPPDRFAHRPSRCRCSSAAQRCHRGLEPLRRVPFQSWTAEASSCHSVLIVRPRPIFQDRLHRVEVLRIGILRCLEILLRDCDDAAIVSSRGDFGRWFVGDHRRTESSSSSPSYQRG